MTAGLECAALTVAYGGNVAVDNVSFIAPLGSITGLIGPNGAGKTTTFNACNGFVRPGSGTVTLLGEDVTDADPAARARAGMGRTFQRAEVCASMSLRENVALGIEAKLAGRRLLRHLVGGRAQRQAIAAATDDALAICGATSLADRSARTLSTGQRRLLELARVVACGFQVLLLDEPSSGLDVRETSAFGTILQRLVDERGVALLLVEHDMDLVMTVCERVCVLDFGRLVFVGTPGAAAASDVVRAAYLGEDAA